MNIHTNMNGVSNGIQSGENTSTPPGGVQHVDIAVLLHNLDKFYLLVEPIQTLMNTVQEVHGWAWRRPSMVLGLNIACAICSSGSILSVLLLCTLSAAALGVAHLQTGILKKTLPHTTETHSSAMTRQQLLQHYKLQLYQVNDVIHQCNSKMEKFYSFVKWDSPRFSAKCYCIIVGILLCVFLLPANVNLMLFVNAALLLNTSQGFRGSISEIKETFKSRSVSKKLALNVTETVPAVKEVEKREEHENQTTEHRKCSVSDHNDVIFHEAVDVSSTDEESNMNNFHAEYDNGIKLTSSSEESDFEFDASQAEIPIDDCSDIHKQPEFYGTSSMPDSESLKATEIRQKYKQQQIEAMTGFCTRCGTEFSTLSKKRHYCSNCGNHFCFRCCSYRVPKSVFGATAPGSDTETVPVCCDCYTELTDTTCTTTNKES